jgi:ADP-heptose:LPS heptosyltransferase
LNKLAVLHLGAIGDFILTLSVVQAARDYLKPHSVVAIASAPLGKIMVGRSVVNRWFCPEQVGLHSLFSDTGPPDERLAGVLRDTKYILNFTGDESKPVYQRLDDHTSAKVISVDPQPSEQTIQKRLHITTQWCSQIRAAGLNIGDPTPPVIQQQTDNARWHNTKMVIHPGSGGRHKCWPIDCFIELADSVDHDEVHWILGPAECEKNQDMVKRLQERVGLKNETLIINQELDHVTKLIADADLYIGNDSGITHLAAAVGTLTVALFGPSDPNVWRPLGQHVQIVSTEQYDKPIGNIQVEKVRKEITRITMG